MYVRRLFLLYTTENPDVHCRVILEVRTWQLSDPLEGRDLNFLIIIALNLEKLLEDANDLSPGNRPWIHLVKRSPLISIRLITHSTWLSFFHINLVVSPTLATSKQRLLQRSTVTFFWKFKADIFPCLVLPIKS